MLGKVLVANRGEIAIRIMRACRELGIKSVAVYSEADKYALFSKYADEAYLLGTAPASQSYLNIDKIIEIARNCNADAIHPGYGFLSENPDFAEACEIAGITFIGPPSSVLKITGNKVAARKEALKVKVPLIAGSEEPASDINVVKEMVRTVGYPVIIKPANGGGGIGMSIINSEEELEKSIATSMSIAQSSFGTNDIYIEKYLVNPRHIEFQILADKFGNVVHLGERECSIQRNYGKIIEESPSVALNDSMRKKMGNQAVKLARSLKYIGAGTVEFIFSKGKYYFLEVNARIQVEHGVTEMVTGIDLVKEQIRIASDLPLSVKQKDVRMTGWAIECRINAEDPLNNFMPSPGTLKGYRSPGGIGIRVDSGVHNGYTIPDCYHPMISKLIVHGRDRNETIIRMRRALYEYIIVGVKTNIILHKAIMENPRFVSGNLETGFIKRETGLQVNMKRIAERDYPLIERLSEIFNFKGDE
ncbi:MAG: acetyl-CoA carboxylase biotin carboxylase subunit [Dehalococcoidales bacterium]|jgi:pyruvate carboxylase subunit A|nr:acetyl-CoA carboxylase biotin carboxylase subunit [Dehalococcoidales bacterium]NLT28300.1 acetyl-CoA carboxylase biotin carboxylase subunit [Dehalococcoidales bacterium]